jgi:hypothetical protein
MRRTHDTRRARGRYRSAPLLFAGLFAAAVLGAPTIARPSDATVTLEPAAPAATVWMLSAPHTGRRLCEVTASTPVRFVARAKHGPHRYARVEVLEGECAGMEGYVPWATLEPEPR